MPVTFTGQNPDLDDEFTFEHDERKVQINKEMFNFYSTNVDPVEGKPNTVRVHFGNKVNLLKVTSELLNFDNVEAIKGA